MIDHISIEKWSKIDLSDLRRAVYMDSMQQIRFDR